MSLCLTLYTLVPNKIVGFFSPSLILQRTLYFYKWFLASSHPPNLLAYLSALGKELILDRSQTGMFPFLGNHRLVRVLARFSEIFHVVIEDQNLEGILGV